MIAIYARQSVNKLDSISIETQIEECEKEIRKGESAKIYSDKGYSGKNTDRPEFQKLMEDIGNGKVSKVVCYKLDRVSRSVVDFAILMESFKKHNVSFVSCNEKFDTETAMGRAMLSICIVFAQLERETIQQRVIDAYRSRSQKGFYMGGRCPYGYRIEEYVIDGIKTSHYVVVPEEAEVLKLMYSFYSQPQVSVGDVVKYLVEADIKNTRGKNGCWDKARVSELMKNPIYVKASIDVYEFFKTQGVVLHNNPEDFVGTNGCYLYSEKEARRKTVCLEGHHIVIAPHEGIIEPDIWLKVRMKCLGNKQVAKPIKAKNTWLAGKIKCKECGYALVIKKSSTKAGRYFVCSRNGQTLNGCKGIGGLYASDVEQIVFDSMSDKLKEFTSLSSTQKNKENPKINEIRIEIANLQAVIDSWIAKIPDASQTVMNIINEKVEKLAQEKQALENKLRDLTVAEHSSSCDTNEIRNYMSKWDGLEISDKMSIVDALISVIRADQNSIDIEWKI